MAEQIKWFSPAQVAEITGVSVDLQRDWRRRGFGYFGRDNGKGRWQYTTHDILGITIAQILRRKHFESFEAARIGHHSASNLALILGLEAVRIDRLRTLVGEERANEAVSAGYISQDKAARFVFFVPEANPVISDDPGYASVLDSSIWTVIDCIELAKEIPAGTIEAIKS